MYLQTKGRQQGAKEVLLQMERLMGSGYHLTITYFWIQLVDFALNSKASSPPPTDTSFAAFRGQHPELLDEKLYLQYYKKETIFAPSAEQAMVLPDKKPLPAIVMARAK